MLGDEIEALGSRRGRRQETAVAAWRAAQSLPIVSQIADGRGDSRSRGGGRAAGRLAFSTSPGFSSEAPPPLPGLPTLRKCFCACVRTCPCGEAAAAALGSLCGGMRFYRCCRGAARANGHVSDYKMKF